MRAGFPPSPASEEAAEVRFIGMDECVDAILMILDVRDPLTYEHSRRVAGIAGRVGWVLGFGERDMEALRAAAKLHDIGKIGVPDGVLNKPGGLTDEERRAIQEHPRRGHDILMRIGAFRPLARIVLHHHERWDGLGYPDGLAMEAIPLPSRIIALADAFDAMTSPRPYREPLPRDWAVGEIRAHKGDQFDSRVVAAFEEILAEIPDSQSPAFRVSCPTRRHEDLMHSIRVPLPKEDERSPAEGELSVEGATGRDI